MKLANERGAALMKSRITKTLPGLLAMAMLVGCGVSKTPSEGDVKEAIKNALTNCEPVKLTDFKYNNGVALDETHHKVNVSFTLEAIPLPENLKIKEDALAHRAEIKDQCTVMLARNRELDQQFDTYDKAFFQLRAGSDSPEYQKLEADLKAKKEERDQFWRENRVFINDCDNRYAADFTTPNTKNHELVVNNFYKVCAGVQNNSFGRDLTKKLLNNPGAFLTKTQSQFTADIIMLKTDKGWVMQNNWRG